MVSHPSFVQKDNMAVMLVNAGAKLTAHATMLAVCLILAPMTSAFPLLSRPNAPITMLVTAPATKISVAKKLEISYSELGCVCSESVACVFGFM